MPEKSPDTRWLPKGERAVFTICATNYLAHASVLGASLRQHHPDLTLTVFLLDSLPPGLAPPPDLDIVPAAAVLNEDEWNHRRAYYEILEFATSVKPACFRFLFSQGVREAIYLDPDIRLLQRLEPFRTRPECDESIVLTPYMLSTFPNDGHMPDDLVIMRAGIYNLGFAAMRNTANSSRFIDWWDRKLHDLCFLDVSTGVFTDQKWMDYAPSFVPDTTILRHPGHNVAYWNMHERVPRLTDDGWKVEDQAGALHDLIFFHFSGFDPGRGQVSKHENRFGASPPGDAPLLFEAYAKALSEAGLSDFAALATPQALTADGYTWDVVLRKLYRQAFAEKLDLGDPLKGPDFVRWAAARAPDDHLARYARAVLHMRPAVAAAYDDGRDETGLQQWLRTFGVVEMGLDPMMLDRIARQPGTTDGVNFVGYLRAHLGVGEAARQGLAALKSVGVEIHPHDISGLARAPTGDYALPVPDSGAGRPAITILNCNADVLPDVLATLPDDMRDTYRIGYWYWETPDFPEAWSDRFDQIDEVWAATHFVAEAIRAKATVPVVVMPPMIGPPSVSRDRSWLSTLLPEVTDDEFVFLFQFDLASISHRKNPEGVIAAFNRAFSPDEPVRLIIKLMNGQSDPAVAERQRAGAEGRRISVIETVLPSEDRFRLLASVDSFVSLHRSEGFGLSIAEAMALGVPVVTTGWSGNADFTTADNAAIVAFDLVPGTEAHGPYPVGTIWAEPRLDSAASQMRRLWTDKPWREAISRAGAETIRQRYSAAVTGTAMKARLDRIQRSGRLHARNAGNKGAVPIAAVAPTGSRAALIARDLARHPDYYLVRLPRLPVLLWRFGLAQVLSQAELVATRRQTRDEAGP